MWPNWKNNNLLERITNTTSLKTIIFKRIYLITPTKTNFNLLVIVSLAMAKHKAVDNTAFIKDMWLVLNSTTCQLIVQACILFHFKLIRKRSSSISMIVVILPKWIMPLLCLICLINSYFIMLFTITIGLSHYLIKLLDYLQQ